MDSKTDLRNFTTKYFDLVNITELNDRWIDEVIDNEFTDAEENSISISILFVDNPMQTLNKLTEVCRAWCQKTSDDESTVSTDTNTSSREEVLWTVLDELDIGVKHLQSTIYLLCNRAMKKNASHEDQLLGLASAKLYFSCLRVPGSGAYSVYHPNLFNLCIDCLPTPDYTSDKDSSATREFERLSTIFVSTLLSLLPVLKDFHFGDDSSTMEHTIKKLVEMTTCEVQYPIDFNNNLSILGEKELKRRFRPSFIASSLAYEALLAILDTDLNGDKDTNYLLILSYLNKSILCYKARKSATVSQKHLLVKDNAVSFVCHNLRTKDFSSEVTQLAVKRLCLGVIDKTEIRATVSSAVITILFHMKNEHLAEMIQWILLLTDSAETKDRVFSLDVLGQLLSNTSKVDPNLLPESLKDDSLNVSIIFAILTRCDDVSPGVRTKALIVLSQNMKCIFNFLDKTKDKTTFEIEDSEDINEKDLDINGNHRYFWYNLTSFRERLNEIAAILQRRIEDNNVTARKAALVALENLMVFDHTYISEENLKFFDSATKDSNIVVRKQVVQSLSAILEVYRENSEIQEAWLKCILPLMQDSENTVQAKALLVLEEQFLLKIFSSVQDDRECAFTLLKLLSSGDFLAHQRYLQKAFNLWKSENKLKPQMIVQLENYIGTEWESCIWFYISYFALYCSLPSKISHCCIEQFEKFHSAGEYPSFMEYILKVIVHKFQSLSLEESEKIRSITCDSLKSFSNPVELIPIYIEILYKIHKHRKTDSEFAEFSSTVIQKCEEHLLEIKSEGLFPEPSSEELLAKYFCTIKEFCQLCSSSITPSVVSLLQTFSASVEIPKTLSKILSPSLRAHAFAALGKICLQDEILAKDLLPVYAKELLSSKHDVIRSNIVIILIEMCKRYTSFADKYVPLISLCFKDKLYLIRYQTIVLVVNLLQEGYIKWRGPLFFCLLSSLVDKKEDIQELGRYSLSQLLHDKKKNLFSEHFIDSIFVFNNFPPPDNETVAQHVKDLERFALAGESRREERMLLYRFLLESMDIKERAYLIKSICEIVMSVAETVYPLNETTECIVRDCFAILTCKEIRAYNLEQFEDMDEATENEFCRTELDMRRVVIIEPVIPVIVSLKNGITDPESDLMHDIILFLKELLFDFRDNLKDILAVDKILLRQLELEIKNDVERERTDKRMEKDLKEKNKQPSTEKKPEPTAPVTMEGIQTMINDVSKILVQDKEESKLGPTSEQTSKAPSQQIQRTPPKQTSKRPPQQTLRTPPQQASRTPPQQASRTPPQQASRTPPQQTSRTPPQQTSRTPPQQTSRTPPQQTSRTPPQQTSRTPPQQTSRTPPQQISRTPPQQISRTPPQQTRHGRRVSSRSSSRDTATNRPSTSGENSQPRTYNIATTNPAEANDIRRLASTPRVLLTPVKFPLTTNILNVSAIEGTQDRMILDDSDED